MPNLGVDFDLRDGSWREATVDPNTGNLKPGIKWMGADSTQVAVGRMPGLEDAGNSTAVLIRALDADGNGVIIETTLKLFVHAAKMLEAIDRDSTPGDNG